MGILIKFIVGIIQLNNNNYLAVCKIKLQNISIYYRVEKVRIYEGCQRRENDCYSTMASVNYSYTAFQFIFSPALPLQKELHRTY